MRLIYEFIEQPHFEHDFNNLEYQENEFDEKMNTPGLHTVRRKVTYQQRATILPPDLFEKFSKLSFWEQDDNTKANRICE